MLVVAGLVSMPLSAIAEEEDPWAGVEEMRVLASAAPIAVFTDENIELQVLEKVEIEAQPNLTAADAVSKLPGIRTSQRIQGDRAVVSIEGLPPEYTRILVNGQRYTGQVGAVADLEDVPLTNLERMEIQRGAQGLAHGPNSGGGVINLRTLLPPDEGVKADVWGGLGSDNKRLLATTVAAANGENSGASFSYTHDEIGGYDPRESGAVFVNIGGSQSVRRSDDVYATQLIGSRNAEHAALRVGYRQEEERYIDTSGISIGSSEVNRWLVSAEGILNPTNSTRVRGGLTYYDLEVENEVARATTVGDKEVRGEISVTQDIELPWFGTEWKAGVDARQLIFSLEESPLPFMPGPGQDDLLGDRNFTKYATTAGFYGALDADFTSWISATAGVRLQLDSRFDPQVAPQFGVVISPTDWIRFRIQYGRSDRYPSLNDLYQPPVAQNGGQYFLAGNRDLTPEQADTWRVGFEYEYEDIFSVSTTAFLNEIDDFIRYIFEDSIQTGVNQFDIALAPSTPLCVANPTFFLCSDTPILQDSPVFSDLFMRRNLEYVRTRGIEGQARFRPLHWLLFRVGYTYLDTKVDSDRFPDLEELPNEPRHTVDLEVRLTSPWPLGPLGEPQLTTVARYRSAAVEEVSGTGGSSFTSNNRVGTSWIVDARLKVPLGPAASFDFDIRNLIDETTVDSNEIRGRTFFGGLRVQWPTPD